jgi:hypothetical protein
MTSEERSKEMTPEERLKGLELLERLRTAIIRAKLGGLLDIEDEEERREKEAKIRKCCHHYNKLKLQLNIK